ncbi:hypothetical protein [Flavobacterium taihuense]|uniref:Uncharacterized protein n=1 Tax=Flavobacterium taihuense TaxID=2857508 RepID=A0ABS6Y0Q2_9FLAO|nr:hypothetical protein [Flavobacterium taihuense]MBW4362496.1 hypothetical protein [Flavobacterium taihuense]
MTKENVKTSHTDVMPAMAEFLLEVSAEDIQKMPAVFQFIFDIELETENMNDLTLRIEVMRAIRDLRTLTDKLKPFSDHQIETGASSFIKQSKSRIHV